MRTPEDNNEFAGFGKKRRSLVSSWRLLAILLFYVNTNAGNTPVSDEIREQLAGLRCVPKNGSMQDSGQDEQMRIAFNRDGTVRFLGAPSDFHFQVSVPRPGDPETTAEEFITAYKGLFGASSAATGFSTKRIRSVDSRNYIRFRQTYSDIPVFGGEVIIQLDDSGGIVCVISDIMRNTHELDRGQVAITPAISAEDIRVRARNLFISEDPFVRVDASPPELMLFDPSVLGADGAIHLVWKIRVYSEGAPLINEQLLLDAHSGDVIRHYPLNINALDREIYDANNTSSNPGTLRREEGDAPSGFQDVDDAYDFLGHTYTYYLSEHARDGIDDAGMTIEATVRYCYPGKDCPYPNAFWSGSVERFYFGDDYAVDDVVGHEYTHGVTSYESDLIYENHSGAINESFSDIWGEYVDLGNGVGDDSPGVRWEIGEDLPIGAIRDMSDPTLFNDPDRMGSAFFIAPVADPSDANDYGGVHTNCGVSNKLCYLLTDGDTFNGQTVTGMGRSRIADLYYEVQTNLLSSGADYTDLYFALSQAAANHSWTTSEKNNLHRACAAVEIAEERNVYVDWTNTGTEDGTISHPYNTIIEGYYAAFSGDRLYIGTGVYHELINFNKIMTIRATDGDVIVDGIH